MLNDQEWELEQARFNLEYWDHRVAEAKKALRRSAIRLALMVIALIAEWILVFIFFPFWLGVLTISVGTIAGTGLYHLGKKINAAS